MQRQVGQGRWVEQGRWIEQGRWVGKGRRAGDAKMVQGRIALVASVSGSWELDKGSWLLVELGLPSGSEDMLVMAKGITCIRSLQ